MKILLTFLLLLPLALPVSGQSYKDSLLAYQQKYIAELLAEPNGPVKPRQARNISFFPADAAYRVWADFKPTPGAVPFMVPTHSGKTKPYKEYGKLTFYIHDTLLTLSIYQSINMIADPQYKDYLFLPFNDMTNYLTTYGGGRYIDLRLGDIQNGRVLIDFNKAYNPYCAYADGYSCPIPPDENHLRIEIPAGEKSFIQ